MKRIFRIAIVILASAAALSCTAQRKLGKVRDGALQAALAIPQKEETSPYEISTAIRGSDTLVVQDLDGKDVFIMKAVRDSLSGEMVASDVLKPAVVVARFRNVAERGGKVNIVFQIQVPQMMLDPRWQMRLFPTMKVLSGTVPLEGVCITGNEYRRSQMRGYERYNRFLESIVSDSTRFIDRRQFEIFISRNMPDLYALRTDSLYVSDVQFQSIYGVTQKEAVEHYTDKVARWVNNNRISSRGRRYARYVKVPIKTDGLRIDTVLRSIPETFEYDYSETIATRPRLKKVEIFLAGGIWEGNDEIYRMSSVEPVTFYISSLVSFVDNRPRYLDKVIERRAESSDTYELIFPSSGTELNPSVGDNAAEIIRIKERLSGLMTDDVFELDSIVVTSSASPEGEWRVNEKLSRLRSASICRYFDKYVSHYRDSCSRAEKMAIRSGLKVNLDEEYTDSDRFDATAIRFVPHSIPENWQLLDRLVDSDTAISPTDRRFYFDCNSGVDMDGREKRLAENGRLYSYLRKNLYGQCRNVVFNFRMHRREMTKDTVHTAVPDERYAEGVRLLKERDYTAALDILADYRDYNTALAYSLLDRNASAVAILEEMDRSAEVDYMLAVLYSRQGKIDDAVKCYVASCAKNSSFKHRGNLDPEIFPLIKTYGLNREED